MAEFHHIQSNMKHHHFFALLFAALLLFPACGGDDTTVDPALTATTILLKNFELSAFVVDTDTVDVVPGTDKSPNDPVTIPLDVRVEVQSTRGVASVACTVTLDGKSQVIAESPLTDAGGGAWTTRITLALHRGDVGDYKIEITGRDDAGMTSNIALGKLRVYYGLLPPVLLEVIAPDTLNLRAVPFTDVISVRVSDPSGLGDIKQVFFNSYLPNGDASQGNPFLMLDDGNTGTGDAVAGDGIYSLRITIPPTAMKGVQRFEFHALDYSNLSSNVLIHTIVIQ